MKRASLVTVILVLTMSLPLAAGESEVEMMILPHLGGSLAVSFDVVETAFFMDKDGRQRFHLVWSGNPEGKTLEGAGAVEAWTKIREGREKDFLWTAHMGGTLGIARRAIVRVLHGGEGREARDAADQLRDRLEDDRGPGRRGALGDAHEMTAARRPARAARARGWRA
jgi:hypothetical protein